MNSTEIKAIILQTIQFLVIIMIISFVLDIGFDRFTKEPFMELVSNWFASIFTLGKMGLWVLISLVYSYFRVTKLKKS